MFIKTQGFKRLIQEAYKMDCLKVGRDEDGIYIAGGYWVLQVKDGLLPKAELGELIKLTGELPEIGTGFTASKNGNQYEIQANRYYRVIRNAEDCKDKLVITRLLINGNRILQNESTGDCVEIQDKFVDMIDIKSTEWEKGEDYPEGPLTGEHAGVFWKNNMMALYVMPVANQKDERLLRILGGYIIEEEE